MRINALDDQIEPEEKISPYGLVVLFLAILLGVGVFILELRSQSDRGEKPFFLLGLLIAIALLAQFLFPSGLKSRFAYLKPVAIIGLSLALATYLFGDNLRAGFYLIDDHQIVQYLGSDGRLSAAEIPKLFLETEAGRPGDFPRYRPSYYLTRLVETALWRANPAIWYGVRLLMAVLVMAVLWYLLQGKIGLLAGGLLVLFIFSFATWGDIFTRLGPAETYATFGLALFGLGSYGIIHERAERPGRLSITVNWLLVTVGAFLAIGSKENLLILAPLSLVVLYLAHKKNRSGLLGDVCVSAILIYSLFITWAVVTALAKSGQTIYAQSVAPVDRLDVLLSGFTSPPSLIMLIIALSLGILWIIIRTIKGASQIGRITLVAFSLISLCWLVYVSQYAFYNGVWPVGNRYDMPGIFAYKPFYFLVLAWFGITALKKLNVRREIYLGLGAGLMIGLALIISRNDLKRIKQISQTNVELSAGFATKLDHIAEKLEQNPEAALVIEIHVPNNYEEAVRGWPQFLRARGIANPIFLRLHSFSSDTVETDRDISLAILLETISAEGRFETSPLAEFDKYRENCFSLHLSGYTETECANIAD